MAILPRPLNETARKAVGVNFGRTAGTSPDWVKWASIASIWTAVLLGCAGTGGMLQRARARPNNLGDNIFEW